ncbi:uncharacterized protein AB675_2947 [Cyphellophora attinorum]|uniref:Uncharacterized protein n=1 Tax=Cyphellophora attinorum TaxID=1664694 RepID=A0A0N1HN90_9EURO|nr:uncharacterized protein AB675_2947 [Phialophora attinorum]KPI36445.1 hypothetical protein AB675_2947 [Phialophora attinorum]
MPGNEIEESKEDMILRHLEQLLYQEPSKLRRAYKNVAANVRTVLERQIVNSLAPARTDASQRRMCRFKGEHRLAKVLGSLPLELALFTLARVYDEAHIILCQGRGAARSATQRQAAGSLQQNPKIDLNPLVDNFSAAKVEGQIVLLNSDDPAWPYRFEWQRVPEMSFDCLDRLSSLAEHLPGERGPCREYAGIGGGGGSDIISASAFGHLLREQGKEMNVLVSTRTWATGSQGKQGSKLGIKREVYDHAGQVMINGKIIPGTFKVQEGTSSEGRGLEHIPASKHEQVYIVLDQNGSRSDIAQEDRAELKDQLKAVLGDSQPPLETIAIVDTGGDVFGADGSGATTPDQDLRVQQAMCTDVFDKYNLITVVMAPGVDAPDNAPQKALEAGAKVYSPNDDEKQLLLHLLKDEYRMDGSEEGRFGKTTLALQARLNGAVGWTSLDLPCHIVDTWDNPWSSFVYIRKCMSDIILIPTKQLLPLIDPSAKSG